MTPAEIDKEIREFEPNIETDSEDFWAYRVLLSATQTGPYKHLSDFAKKTAQFWGVKPVKVRRLCLRAMDNNIIRLQQEQFLDGEIYADGIGLALGAAVLRGFLQRAQADSSREVKNEVGK